MGSLIAWVIIISAFLLVCVGGMAIMEREDLIQ